MRYGRIKNNHIISNMIVFLTTLYNGDCPPFDIKKTAKVIMASFHDKENAHKFLVKLSMHTLTKKELFEIVKKAYSEIYDEFEDELSTEHRIKETIIEFADEVSYHLMRITDIYKTDVAYIAYVIIFNSIKLFTNESDVTIFAARLTGKNTSFFTLSICWKMFKWLPIYAKNGSIKHSEFDIRCDGNAK